MSIPEEFIADAIEIGYGVNPQDVRRLDASWQDQAETVQKFAAMGGFQVVLEGRRVWGYKEDDTYLLASATQPGDDPMNLWAQAFQRLDLILSKVTL